jgi:hypothetical protein
LRPRVSGCLPEHKLRTLRTRSVRRASGLVQTALSEKCGPPGVVLGAKTRFAPELVPVESSALRQVTGFRTGRGARALSSVIGSFRERKGPSRLQCGPHPVGWPAAENQFTSRSAGRQFEECWFKTHTASRGVPRLLAPRGWPPEDCGPTLSCAKPRIVVPPPAKNRSVSTMPDGFSAVCKPTRTEVANTYLDRRGASPKTAGMGFVSGKYFEYCPYQRT